jgi:hypothetical protein
MYLYQAHFAFSPEADPAPDPSLPASAAKASTLLRIITQLALAAFGLSLFLAAFLSIFVLLAAV